MATLLNAPDLPSSDEEDADFVPGTEAGVGEKAAAKKKRKTLEPPSSPREVDTVAPRSKLPAAKQARVDAAWELLSKGKQNGRKPAGKVSLTSLCAPIQTAAIDLNKEVSAIRG